MSGPAAPFDRAIVIPVPRGSPHLSLVREGKLLGFSPAERTLLSLARSGVKRIYFPGGVPGEIAGRLRESGLREVPGLVLGDLSAEAVGESAAGGVIPVVLEGTLFDPGLLERMSRRHAGGGGSLRVSGPGGTKGGVTLSAADAVARLALGLSWDDAPGAPFDVSPGWAVTVTSRATLRESRRLLLGSVRKETDGLVSRRLNRPVSLQLTRLFILLGVSPNVVSLLGLATALGGAWAVSRGGYWPTLAGAGLFQLASILDGSDGEVAKLTCRQSAYGSWMDTLCDELACLAFFAALPLGLSRRTGDPVFLRLGGTIAAAAAILFLLMIAHLRRAGGAGSMVRLLDEFGAAASTPGAGGMLSGLVARFSFAVRRDFFSLAILLLCLAGLSAAVVWTLALGLVSAVVFFSWFSLRARN